MKAVDPEYKKLLDSYKKHGNNRWALGDDTNAYFGRSDGIESELGKLHRDLLKQGDSYSMADINMFSRIAALFPPEKRERNICWSGHAAAGTPEMLARIKANNPNIRTVNDIRGQRKSLEASDRADQDASDKAAKTDEEKVSDIVEEGEAITDGLNAHERKQEKRRAKDIKVNGKSLLTYMNGELYSSALEGRTYVDKVDPFIEVLTEAEAKRYCNKTAELIGIWQEHMDRLEAHAAAIAAEKDAAVN